MPSVPRYGVAQTQNIANPNIRVNEQADIRSFGGGQGLAQVGGAAEQLTKSVMDRADEIAVMEAERKLNDWETKYLYSTGEDDGAGGRKNQGAFYKKGKDAFEIPKATNEEFEKTRTEIMSGMSSPRQKAIFEQRALQKKQMIDRQIQKHVGNEIEKYEADTFKSYMQSERQSAVYNYQDPMAVKVAINNQKEKLLTFGKNQGWDAETMKLNVQNAESQTHADVISRMISNGDDITAQKYFDQNKDGITGAHIEKVEQEIQAGATMGFAQRTADDFMRKGLNESQALKEAAKVDNPKMREALESRLTRMYNMKEQADNQRQQDTFNAITKAFDQTGDIPPQYTQAILSLKPEYREALDRYRDRNPLRDDGVLFHKLNEMATNPETRQKFANHDLLLEKANLSKEHFEKLYKYQKDIKGGKDTAGKELDGAYSDGQVIQSVYEAAGFKTSDKEDYAKFKNRIDEVIETESKKKGKKLSNSEIRELAKQQTMEVVTSKGVFWDSKSPKFLIDQETIPSKDREMIVETLQKRGRPVTEKNILDLFFMKAQANGK